MIAMGRRWGKTFMCGVYALTIADYGGAVAWIAPTYKNARPLWRFAESHCAGTSVVITRAERAISFPSGGRISIYSADNIDAVRGESFDVVIIDEAARVAEEAWTEAIQPTLADRDGRAMLISTPKGRNWFWREFQRGVAREPDYAAFTAPSEANPNPSIREAARRARLVIPDRVYRQEWLAEFVEEASVVFLRSWFDDARYDARDQALRNLVVARWHSWDTAISDKEETSAYTSLVVGELMPDYRLIVREVYRDHLTFPELVAAILRFAQRDMHDGKLRGVIIEDKASGTSAIQTIRASDSTLSRYLIPFVPTTSKEQRAEQASVWCANGSVLLPHPGPEVRWLEAFEDELFAFPSSQYVDQVDAFSQLVLYLEHLLSEGYNARIARGGEVWPASI